jgi:hypothetical protein
MNPTPKKSIVLKKNYATSLITKLLGDKVSKGLSIEINFDKIYSLIQCRQNWQHDSPIIWWIRFIPTNDAKVAMDHASC